MGMNGKENLDRNTFRNTSAELGPRPDPTNKRISKTVRMRIRYSDILRDEAFKRTVQTGSKVSEADLIDLALTDWLAKEGLIELAENEAKDEPKDEPKENNER